VVLLFQVLALDQIEAPFWQMGICQAELVSLARWFVTYLLHLWQAHAHMRLKQVLQPSVYLTGGQRACASV